MSSFESRSYPAPVAIGHRPGSRITRVICGIAAVLLSSSCSFGTPSDDARSRLPEILRQLSSEVNSKRLHEERVPEDLSQYLEVAKRDLSAIRRTAADWKSTSAKARLGQEPQDGLPRKAEVESFTVALDSWIAAQQEQADVLQSCLAEVDPPACIQSGFLQNSERWVGAQSQLKDAQQRMLNDAKVDPGGGSPSSATP